MDTQLADGTTIRLTTDQSGNQSVTTIPPRPGLLIDPPAVAARVGSIAYYVPYTKVHPATVAGAPAGTVWVDVSSSDDAYFGALHGWWARCKDFAVIEHDVVCRPDVVQAFEDCPEPWCVFGYDPMCHEGCMDAWRNALGCTRFRAELIAAVPDAVSSIPVDGRDWHGLCDGLGANLRTAGFTHHWHRPPVTHHRFGAWDEET